MPCRIRKATSDSRLHAKPHSSDAIVKVATQIAGMAPLAVKAVKEMVDAAFETPLTQGIRFERRLFHGLFGTADQKEGMAAFVEKRAGEWVGR